jgi:hypothetical protein
MMYSPWLKLFRSITAFFLLAGGLSVSVLSVRAATGDDDEFNRKGNFLISDQFNNRVIEIDPDGKIVWHFGNGPADFSKHSIIGVNDAQRVGDLTLLAGTGTPGGQPEAPNCTMPSGCPDNRVLLVNRWGHIVWQYGTFGTGGSGPGQLNTPVQVTWLPTRHVLITDQGNGRIIEVRVSDKETVWEYDGLNNPNCAELLENGHILICDENNNQALEVTHTKPSTIVHTYIQAGGQLFSGVAFASRLPNGHTLITDSGNNRIVETDEAGDVFWQYLTNIDANSTLRSGGPLPTRALRLRDGNTLISDQYNHRVIEVTPDFQIVRTFGKIATLGYDTHSVANGGLNSPYDAKRIGDYTGITPPFDHNKDADDKD